MKGVFFGKTKITRIDGNNRILQYRGYPIEELAQKSTYEEVAYLLIHGELPTSEELAGFAQELKKRRDLPDGFIAFLHHLKELHPVDALLVALPYLQKYATHGRNDISQEAHLEEGMGVIARLPTIIAAQYRITTGREPIAPSNELGHAGNFLYMLKGNLPSELETKVLDIDFILHADHDANASTLAAMVTTGAKSNVYKSMTAGIAALAGPAHGGAAEDVMDMLRNEIKTVDNVASYVKKKGMRITGYGHRVYKKGDPRADFLRQLVLKLCEEFGKFDELNILLELENVMRKYQHKGHYPNVDFFSGIAYDLLGIAKELFVPIFAVSRSAGWLAHIIEHGPLLIRPQKSYFGNRDKVYIPIDKRSYNRGQA